MNTIEDLKVGDEVVTTGGFSDGSSVEVVERLTKTQIITNRGNKFSRLTGTSIGGSIWETRRIDLTADIQAVRERNKKFKMIKTLQSVVMDGRFDFEKIDITKLSGVITYLEGCKK